MSGGAEIAMSTCYGCGDFMTFDVETVPSVVVDARTGEPAAEDCPVEFGVCMPLCVACVDRVEAYRRSHNMPKAWPHRRPARYEGM